MAKINCPYCKKEVENSSERCTFCGYKMLPEVLDNFFHLVQCPTCKQDSLQNIKKCIYCGSDLPIVNADSTHLVSCPNCKKNTISSAEECIYCGFKFTVKNIKDLHLIYCPRCKTDIANTSEECHKCGYRIKPIDPEEKKDEDRKDLISELVAFAVIVLLVIFLIIIFSPEKGSKENKPPSRSVNVSEYYVKDQIIPAATSEENFDIMIDCVVNQDKVAFENMVLTGQIKYLYEGDVVYLVKTKFGKCLIRLRGSTEQLWVTWESIAHR